MTFNVLYKSGDTATFTYNLSEDETYRDAWVRIAREASVCGEVDRIEWIKEDPKRKFKSEACKEISALMGHLATLPEEMESIDLMDAIIYYINDARKGVERLNTYKDNNKSEAEALKHT